jgi:hypothetical protein
LRLVVDLLEGVQLTGEHGNLMVPLGESPLAFPESLPERVQGRRVFAFRIHDVLKADGGPSL